MNQAHPYIYAGFCLRQARSFTRVLSFIHMYDRIF